VNASPAPAPSTAGPGRRGLRVGPVRLTLVRIVAVLVLLGGLAYVAYVVAVVRDEQIKWLGIGFAAVGAALAAIGIDALTGMWRAAARAQGGRAFGLAILGGLAGLAAIGSFTVTALSMLLWTS
jgi:hypothetical protein